MQDTHKTALPPAVITEIEGHLKQILTLLEPYKVPITSDEKKAMALIGDRSLAFLEKAKEYAQLYPELVPSWCKMPDFLNDFNDVHNTIGIRSLARQVVDSIFNIFYRAGSEAYHWGLDIYHAIRQAAHRGVPGAQIAADDMGKRFDGQGNKKTH